MNPQNPEAVYVATHHGIVIRSSEEDAGQSWEPLGSSEMEGIVLHMASAPSDPSILYAATDQNQVYQSSDGGETWTVLN